MSIVKVGHQAVITDFAHGWESHGHVLRVAVSEKGAYSFSIDGVEFKDFPSQSDSKKKYKEMMEKRSGKREEPTTRPRRLSSEKKLEKRHSATFDPFSTDTTGSTASSTTKASSSSSFFDQESDGFGSGFDSKDPFAASIQQTTDPFTEGFGNVGAVTNTSKSTTANAFDNPKKDESIRPNRPATLTRQFTSPPEQYEANATNTFNSEDLFADQSSTTAPSQQPQHQFASQDFFNDSIAPPPPPQQQSQTRITTSQDFFNDSKPQQQIGQPSSSSTFDFTGMTFELPPPSPMERHKSIPDVLDPQQNQQKSPQQQQQQHQQQQSRNQSGSESMFGLVNLDLSHNNQPKVSNQKSIYDTSSASSTQTKVSQAPINPFDDFNHTQPTTQQAYQQPQYGSSYGGNMGQSNWMASNNIGMMSNQSGYMNQSNKPQSQGKSSLDSLDWKNM